MDNGARSTPHAHLVSAYSRRRRFCLNGGRLARALALCAALCLAMLLAGRCLAADSLQLGQFRGHVVYLDFWASWCVPCRQSFPWLRAMQSAYGQRGLVVIAVNVDHDHADAERFLHRYPVNFRVLFDPQGVLAERFKVLGMPTSVLLDRQGRQHFTHIGFILRERATYEAQIRHLLAQK